MNAFFVLQLALQLLKGVLAAATKAPANTEGGQAILDAISGAISAIEKVHNDPVTKSQIDTLMVSKLW